MSNTISEGEIVIKDELPEAEPIKILNLRPRKQKTIKIKPELEPKRKKEIVVVAKKVESPQDAPTKNFPCKLCDKAFKNKYHLKRHQQNHDAQAIYPCSFCGKNFKTPHLLWQHSFVHKNTRDFHCDLCGKSFKTRSNLLQHKYGHATEKIFKCSICDKAFNKKALMRGHERNHTEERPFICPDCGFAFKLKSTLQNHQKKSCEFVKLQVPYFVITPLS